MLEGLEISEVSLSYVLANNDAFRIDSSYFQKTFLEAERTIRGKFSKTLLNSGAELRSFGAYSLNNEVQYLDHGVPFVRGVNMKKGRISFSNLIYISEVAHSLLWKSEVKPAMVLLSMSGSIGDVAIASKKWKYPINSNQDIAKIDTAGKINPYFLYAFLASSYGQNYLLREARGSVQQHVFLSQIERFEIPVFSNQFDSSIQRAIERSDDLLGSSEFEFSTAEKSLLTSIDIAKFEVSLEPVNIKSFSQSFANTGRLDAEHYQPKYEELHKALSSKNKVFRLGDCLSFNQRGSQPDYADTGLRVINSKHVQRGEVLIDDTRFAVLPDKDNAVFIEQGDVLINGTGVGTIGRAAPYLHKQRALPDNHVTVLRTDAMSPICLAMYLNSIAGQMQVDQHFKGSSGQIELYPADIANFWCPEIDKATQAKIDALAQSSFELKAKSERLLEAAIRAVEIAIEQDEATGMAHLKSAMSA